MKTRLVLSAFLFLMLVSCAHMVSTVAGEQIYYTPLTQSQAIAFDETIEHYNGNVKAMPPFITGFLGDETVRTQVKLDDGSTIIASSDCNGGEIVSSEIIGKIDPENEARISKTNELVIDDQKKEYTVAVYIDEETIKRIASSKNPQKEFVNAWGKDIKYEGLNFFSGTKTFFIGITIGVYSLFVPEENATVLEACQLKEEIIPEQCFSGSGGGSANYPLSNNFSEICNEMDAKGPAGYAGETDYTYTWTYCVGFETAVDEKSCTCECTAKVKDAKVGLTVSQILPEWDPAAHNATQKQTAAWNNFITNLKKHEDKHKKIAEDGKADIEKEIDSPSSGTAGGKSCSEACGKININDLKAEVERRGNSGRDKVNTKQTEYDTQTNHGETEGSVLDCNDP